MFMLVGAVCVANEATMSITADVIKPITVISNGNLDFGRIIQGSNAGDSSSFTVKGQEYSNIKISYPGSNELYERSYSTMLANENGDTMEVVFNDFGDYAIDGTGQTTIEISATCSADDQQPLGKYNGFITMRATYE